MQEDTKTRIRCRIVLPTTFIGTLQYMQKFFHDNMVLVRILGKPDLFVTIMYNLTWSEITNELELGQSPHNCPNVVVYIFQLKLRAMMDEITKKNVLGEIITFCYVIEFQKHSLPMLTFFFG